MGGTPLDDSLAFMGLAVALSVLPTHSFAMRQEPLPVGFGSTSPQGAWVLGVRGSVGRLGACVADHGAEHLCSLKNHLDNMFVAEHLSSDLGVLVDDEYIHRFIVSILPFLSVYTTLFIPTWRIALSHMGHGLLIRDCPSLLTRAV